MKLIADVGRFSIYNGSRYTLSRYHVKELVWISMLTCLVRFTESWVAEMIPPQINSPHLLTKSYISARPIEDMGEKIQDPL